MPARLINGQRSAVSPEAKLINGINANTDLSKRGVGLIRGPKSNGNNTNAAWTNTWPAAGASLDIDFVNDQSFIKGVGTGTAMQNLTYTRASNATYIGSDGLLKGAGSDKGALGNNLVPFPQNFENAVWTKSGAFIISSASIAPDGTNTMSKLVESTLNERHNIISTTSVVSAGNYVFSCYLSPAGRDFGALTTFTDNFTSRYSIIIDLINGVVTSTASTGTPIVVGAPTITFVGNGVLRVSLVMTSTSGGIGIGLSTSNSGTPSFAGGLPASQGDGTSGIFIWGAQLELGSTATTYYPTNYNTPRLDWAANIPARNLINYSGDLTVPLGGVSGWSYGNAVFSNGCLFETSATGSHYILQFIPVTIIGSATLTVEVYPNGRDVINFSSANGGLYGQITYTFSTNTFSNAGNRVVSYFSTILSDGYVRLTLTTSYTDGVLLVGLTNNGVGSYAGDVTKGVYIRNPQMESGSVATPYQYIPTIYPFITPLQASTTVNGVLFEEPRTNNLLWCRDASQAPYRNLVAYSEDFSKSVWATFVNGATCFKSTTTDTLPFGGTGTVGTVTYSVVSSGQWAFLGQISTIPESAATVTFSIYAKVSSGTATAYLNVESSTVGPATGNYVASTMNLTTSWQRFSVTGSFSSPAGAVAAIIGVDNRISGQLNASTLTINVWGAQLEYSTIVSNYETTTSSIAIWSKQGITALKDQTGIDGVANACSSLTATSANGVCIQTVTATSASKSCSVFLKRITGTGIIQFTIDGSTWTTVDLSNGIWNRVAMTATIANPSIGIKIVTSGDAVAIDYGQIELNGANLCPTTPIFTTSASATRAVDIATVGNIPNWYNPSKGTLYADFLPLLPQAASSRDVFYIGNTTGTQSAQTISPYFTFGRSFASAKDGVGGGASAVISPYYNNIFTPFKCAISYKQGEVNLADNTLNTAYRTFTAISAFSLSKPVFCQIGGNPLTNSYVGYVKRIIYFPFDMNVNKVKDLTG